MTSATTPRATRVALSASADAAAKAFHHVRELHPTGLFAAIGRFDYRFRRWLPPLGLAVLIGLNGWASVGGGTSIQGGWTITDSEALRAEELLADPSHFGEQETVMFVILRDPDGNADSEEFSITVQDSVAALEDDPAVDGVYTYAQTADPRQLSTDGTTTSVVVRLTEQDEGAVDDAARLAELVESPRGVETIITGVPQVYHEFNEKIESDLVMAELISFPVAMAILLVVFGTLVGALLPILIAGLALGSTFAVVALLASITDMSIFVNNLASMIGIALAIDYALFMVSRFREELRHHNVEIALERMMGSVGKAVAVSGVAVAIGLSSLTVFEAPALRSMGIGGIVSVVSTLVFGLTVLPALLALLGPRVNRLRVPLPGPLRLIEDDPAAADRRQGRGVWSWIARGVMRRPVVVAVPVLALLVAAGLPFLRIQLSTGSNIADLPRTPARTGFEVLRDEFPGGDTDPVTVAVTYADATPARDGFAPEELTELAAYTDRLRDIDGVIDVESVLDPPAAMPEDAYLAVLTLPDDQRPPEVEPWIEDRVAGDTAKLNVFSSFLPDSADGRALIDDVRAAEPPPGAGVLTAGLSSRSHDFMESFLASTPVAVLIVVLVTTGVLFLTFGSVFLPIKAVLMSLISVSASFGALVWIFQEGHVEEILGFEAVGTTAAWLPILMFAILFGLSMDYEVLLLSRIRERYVATRNNRLAVEQGIGITGGIITGAALIMVAVFAAFALSSITFIKALGFTMALAVLVDATIVRGLLVPAFMRVMGRVNWWAPRWVQRAVARLGLYEGPVEADAPAAPRRPEPTPEAAPAG
jgi:RND superfamily putative drug exporter